MCARGAPAWKVLVCAVAVASTALAPLAQSQGGAPDLQVTVSWTPRHPVPDEIVTFVVTVTNAGGAAAGPFRARVGPSVYPSLYTQDVPGLGPGETASATDTLVAIEGETDLVAEADYDKQVVESDESNNARAFSIAATPLSPRGNLRIARVTSTPAFPLEGTTPSLSIDVENTGNATIPAGTRGTVAYGSKVPLEFATGADLAPGARATIGDLRVPFTRAASALGVTLDPADDVAEQSEADNSLAFDAWPAREAPDLVVGNVTFPRSEGVAPTAGSRVALSVEVRNVGAGPAPPGVPISVLWPGSLGAQVVLTAAEIPPGSVVSASGFTGALSQGETRVEVTIDAERLLREPNRANNAKSVLVWSTAPDLRVAGVELDPPAPKLGEAVKVTVLVENAGGSDVPPGASAILSTGTKGVSHGTKLAIPVGGTARIAGWSLFAARSTQLAVVVAPPAGTVESNASNNAWSGPLYDPSKLPTLVATLERSVLHPLQGQAFSIDVFVENRGGGPAPGGFRVKGESCLRPTTTECAPLFLMTHPFDVTVAESLAPGARAKVASQSFTDVGLSMRTRVAIDPEGTIVQAPSIEAGDLDPYGPRAAVVVTSLTWEPAVPEPNEDVAFTVDLANVGPGPARPGTAVSFTSTGGQRAVWVLDEGLEPGETTTFTTTQNAGGGFSRLRVHVNWDEKSAMERVGAAAGHLGSVVDDTLWDADTLPDLIPVIENSPREPFFNAPWVLFVNVTNAGRGPSEGGTLRVTFDGAEVVPHTAISDGTPIDPGETRAFRFDMPPLQGDGRTVIATVNQGISDIELNLQNNVVQRAVRMGARFNVGVVAAGLDKETLVVDGQERVVHRSLATVRNDGPGESGAFTARFSWVGDTTEPPPPGGFTGDVAIASLAPGTEVEIAGPDMSVREGRDQSVTVTVTLIVPDGVARGDNPADNVVATRHSLPTLDAIVVLGALAALALLRRRKA